MKEYKHRNSGLVGSNGQMGMGMLIFVTGLAMMLLFGGGAVLIGSGLLFAVLGAYNQGRAVVTLHGNYFEMKLALLAPRKLVRYDEISAVEDNHVIVRGDKVWLPIAALEPHDAEEIVKELRERMAASR